MISRIQFERHAPIEAFEQVDGELAIGGHTISRLATRLGRTPYFAYSRAAIERRVAQLRAILPPALQLHYAIKANPMPAVVQLLAGLTDGLDVASAREMQVALETGMPATRVSFAGPGKTATEIEQAVAAGVTLNLESASQLTHALSAGMRLGLAPRLAIRVNPGFELKGASMRMAGGPRAFGMDEAQVPAVAAQIEAAGLQVSGLHVYTGSQSLNAAALIEAQRQTVVLAERLTAGMVRGIGSLNIGGGFGVPYFPDEKPLDLAPIGEHLHALAERAQQTMGVPLVIELGRYLVAEAGIYVCRIIERKHSQGQVFLITDGGLHHHLAASGNFGQVIRKNYPVAIGNRLRDPSRAVQSVVGPLCTPLDVLAERMSLAPAQAGDLVVVFQSGAYGPSASPSAFLSHLPAAETLA